MDYSKMTIEALKQEIGKIVSELTKRSPYIEGGGGGGRVAFGDKIEGGHGGGGPPPSFMGGSGGSGRVK